LRARSVTVKPLAVHIGRREDRGECSGWQVCGSLVPANVMRLTEATLVQLRDTLAGQSTFARLCCLGVLIQLRYWRRNLPIFMYDYLAKGRKLTLSGHCRNIEASQEWFSHVKRQT
jgi:hypothetical protein